MNTLLANGGDGHFADADAGRLVLWERVTATLNAGGNDGGFRTDPGAHLVPYVKAKRAQTDQDDETWRAEGPAPTLNAMDNTGESRATVLAVDAYNLAASDAVTPIIGFRPTGGTRGVDAHDDISPTLKVGTGSGGEPTGVATSSTVRRLTPVECERLQGFPDGWTAQRVEQSGKRAGQVVDQPDSARYRQMGNAVTVDVFAWVMRRLAAVDAGGAS